MAAEEGAGEEGQDVDEAGAGADRESLRVGRERHGSGNAGRAVQAQQLVGVVDEERIERIEGLGCRGEREEEGRAPERGRRRGRLAWIGGVRVGKGVAGQSGSFAPYADGSVRGEGGEVD